MEINKAVVEKYRAAFFRPERIVVAFAGVAHEDAVRLTEQYFGDMKSAEGPALHGKGVESTLSGGKEGELPTIHLSTPTANVTANAQAGTSQPNILSKLPFFKNLSSSAPDTATVKALDPSLLKPSSVDLSLTAHYTGGYLTLPPIPPPANPNHPRLSHIHLAFEALPISSPDIYALATLQTLLGGGGSFSAGGPGKGMYSRLDTANVGSHVPRTPSSDP